MIESMDGGQFASALRSGTLAVLDQETLLNRINVFPVPDGDTGYNLAATLRAAADPLGPDAPAAVGDAARLAAAGALDGARGNSGAIFAQFLAGFAEAVRGLTQLGPLDFSRASTEGSAAADRALHAPCEGTILSVLRAWAGALAQHAQIAPNLNALFKRSLPQARSALARTPQQLEVLARAGVVDAGAQGFVTFLEGMSRFLDDGQAPAWQLAAVTPVAEIEDVAAHAEFDSPFRFCTEALVAGSGLDREALDAAVSELGDSLVIAGLGDRLRLHVHTNAPRRFFEIVAASGDLLRCKVDDMWLQHPPTPAGSIALVTDSTCDLPESTAAELAAYVVSLNIEIDGKGFADGRDLAPAAFYQRLRRSKAIPRTSQPAVGEFTRLYERLLLRHEHVVSVHIAAALSGTVGAARTAALRVAPGRIHVVDSRRVSCGLGFVVEAVGRALAAGASVEAALAQAEHATQSIRVFGTVPSLAHAVRGGRLNARVAWILERLGVKPIIEFDEKGEARKGGAKLGFDRALAALVERTERFAASSGMRVMIVHADAEAAAARLATQLRARLGLESVPVLQAGAVLGTHVGPGAVALAALRDDARPG